MTEFDWEVTEERKAYIKNLLVKLYADQTGMEVKDLRVKLTRDDTKQVL